MGFQKGIPTKAGGVIKSTLGKYIKHGKMYQEEKTDFIGKVSSMLIHKYTLVMESLRPHSVSM